MDFQQSYNRKDWQIFLAQNFLPDDYEIQDELINADIQNKYIKNIRLIGECKSLDLKVYEIRHASENDPRVSLSRETFRIMANFIVRRALVLFISDALTNYRFSLVTLDYVLKDGKPTKEYSNPRRYSFFLGTECKKHTPDQYLFKKGRITDFDDLLNRFSIEIVNKEFYNEIAVQFTKLVGGERKIGVKKMQEKGILCLPGRPIDTNHLLYQEFAVRLIGRLVFCWFLKKKKSPAGVSLIPEDILSSLAVRDNEHYYHNILEHLFFQILNTPVKERHQIFRDDHWNKTPFLNGGLFEPHEDDFYDPGLEMINQHFRTLKVPDSWIKELFEIFETWNFTIDENTPVDVELSIDPEMLGRIFENLLAEINPETGETARKDTGSFYTPRPIVEYMVDESLIAYLKSKLIDAIEKDRNFQLTNPAPIGDLWGNTPEEQLKIPEAKFKLPVKDKEKIATDLRALFDYTESQPFTDEKHVHFIISAIDKLKLLDPACGSGAFPMGALQKIVHVLHKLDPENREWKQRQLKKLDAIEDKLLKKRIEESIIAAFTNTELDYGRKLYLIGNCIFGVDIQPIAVEIAKLRCFLSLIVDEPVLDDKENRGILPLPNLEFKFVAANTLIGLYEGNTEVAGTETYVRQLEKLREEWFTCAGKKEVIKRSFLTIQDELSKHIAQYRSDSSVALKMVNWNPFKHEQANFFDAKWMFGINIGFDIVLGNPPYVQLQKDGGRLANMYQKCGYVTFERTGDIYALFYENGVNNLRANGHLCLITSNKWLRAGYGKSLRRFFLTQNLLLLIDLGPGIFANATVDTNIMLLQKRKNSKSLQAVTLTRETDTNTLYDFIHKNSVILKNLSDESWFIGSNAEQKLKEKIERLGKPLKDWNVNIYRGVLTGLNEAFIIDTPTNERLCREDPNSAEILKPILRGRDIKRYSYEWAGLWLIASGFDSNVPELYPAIYKYLLQFEEKAKNRDDQGQNWWNLRSCAYYPEFDKEKVVWKRIGSVLRFGYDVANMYCQDSTCIMTGSKLKYLCAVMNSKVGYKQLYDLAPKTGTGDVIVSVQALEPLLVPPITPENHQLVQRIETLVDEIIQTRAANKDTGAQEKEIDALVYRLYDLTGEEIALVEGNE